jgi:hypothetical protein
MLIGVDRMLALGNHFRTDANVILSVNICLAFSQSESPLDEFGHGLFFTKWFLNRTMSTIFLHEATP